MKTALGGSSVKAAMLETNPCPKVLYHFHGKSFPDTKEKVGDFLGISETCGDVLIFYILTENEKIM